MTNIKTSPPAAGLEGVVATSSTICDIDGAKGVLAYCGYDIHELAQHATFEEVCFLLASPSSYSWRTWRSAITVGRGAVAP